MILAEEIYGNIGTVYHRSRTEPKKFLGFLENNQWKSGSGAGNLYGAGLYTVFNIHDQNGAYGDYLYKLHLKGLKNFYIFLPDVYNHIWGTNYDEEQMLAEQNKRFGINVKSYKDFVKSDSRLHSKVAGIIFYGAHDGNVCIVFNPTNVVPTAFIGPENDDWVKLSPSESFRKSSFKRGGTIEDYNKEVKKEVEKNSIGEWIMLPKFDEERAKDWYWGRRLKPNTSLQVINFIKYKSIKNVKSKEEANDEIGYKDEAFKAKNFNSQAMAIYNKKREFICIVYFDGVSVKTTLPDNAPPRAFLVKWFDKLHQTKKVEERKANKDNSYEKGKVEYYLKFSDVKDYIPKLPDNMGHCLLRGQIWCTKNVYDRSGGLIDSAFSLKFKDPSKEDAEAFCKAIGIKYSDWDWFFEQPSLYGVLKLNAVTGKVVESSEGIPDEISDAILKKLKADYFEKFNRSLLKAYRDDKLSEFENSYYPDHPNSKYNQERAKLEREKIERTAKGRYLGKHQYEALNSSVETYFSY